MRHGYYGKKNSGVVLAVLLGAFLFAGSISANTDDEREADRERFRDAIEERRDAFNGRVRGIANGHASREAEILAAGDGGLFRRILDRISKSRDEFNLRISERRDASEGFFSFVSEKFKTAFLRRAR